MLCLKLNLSFSPSVNFANDMNFGKMTNQVLIICINFESTLNTSTDTNTVNAISVAPDFHVYCTLNEKQTQLGLKKNILDLAGE